MTENLSTISLDCVSIRGRIAAGTPGFPCHINEYVAAIHERFTYRMHDLGEFMKTLLARFCVARSRHAVRSRLLRRSIADGGIAARGIHGGSIGHQRTGALWESRFKSVLVEEGIASRTMAAYIDLNPVRAGMVEDPALYRWSSYGEAMGGGAKGNGAKARAGLVRAIMAHKGYAADARHWAGAVSKEYRMILLAEGMEKLREEVDADGKLQVKVVRKGHEEGGVGGGDGAAGASAGFADAADAAVSGAVFFGWGGDRESWFCGWGVQGVPGAFQRAADEWGAQDAGCGSGGGGSDLECAGFEGGGWGKLKLEMLKAGMCGPLATWTIRSTLLMVHW